MGWCCVGAAGGLAEARTYAASPLPAAELLSTTKPALALQGSLHSPAAGALTHAAALPVAVEETIAALPHDAHPMGTILTGLNALSTLHPEQVQCSLLGVGGRACCQALAGCCFGCPHGCTARRFSWRGRAAPPQTRAHTQPHTPTTTAHPHRNLCRTRRWQARTSTRARRCRISRLCGWWARSQRWRRWPTTVPRAASPLTPTRTWGTQRWVRWEHGCGGGMPAGRLLAPL